MRDYPGLRSVNMHPSTVIAAERWVISQAKKGMTAFADASCGQCEIDRQLMMTLVVIREQIK